MIFLENNFGNFQGDLETFSSVRGPKFLRGPKPAPDHESLGNRFLCSIYQKVRYRLSDWTHKFGQRTKLFSNFPKPLKSFKKWSFEISNAVQLIDYTDYDWQQVSVDAIVL